MKYWIKLWGVTHDQLVIAHRNFGLMTRDIAIEL